MLPYNYIIMPPGGLTQAQIDATVENKDGSTIRLASDGQCVVKYTPDFPGHVPTAFSGNTTYGLTGDKPRAKEIPVTSITRVDQIATVTTQVDHDLINDEVIALVGADQTEYLGRFTISNVMADTFDITVTGSPTTPATGDIMAIYGLDAHLAGPEWNP